MDLDLAALAKEFVFQSLFARCLMPLLGDFSVAQVFDARPTFLMWPAFPQTGVLWNLCLPVVKNFLGCVLPIFVFLNVFPLLIPFHDIHRLVPTLSQAR